MKDALEPELVELLGRHRLAEPGAARIRRMTTRFFDGTPAPHPTTRATILRVVLVVATLGVGTGVGLTLSEPELTSTPEPMASRSTAMTTRRHLTHVLRHTTPTGTETDGPDASAALVGTKPPRRRRASPRYQPVAEESVEPIEHDEELELIKALRDAVRSGRSERAEALLVVHARRFPDGLFVQERKALGVESACGAGKRRLALDRYRTFEIEYPGSALLGRARRCLD